MPSKPDTQADLWLTASPANTVRAIREQAEKLLGKFDALDEFTVSMAHPDATAALMSGATEVDAHFGSPPFQYTQLQDPKITRVLNSYDVLGGPTTFNLVWGREDFRAKNPKTYKAFMEALAEAVKTAMKASSLTNLLLLEQDQFEPDALLHRVILDFSVWHY